MPWINDSACVYIAIFLLLPYVVGADDLLCSHPNLIVANVKSTVFCEVQGGHYYNPLAAVYVCGLFCYYLCRSHSSKWCTDILWVLGFSSLPFASYPCVSIESTELAKISAVSKKCSLS